MLNTFTFFIRNINYLNTSQIFFLSENITQSQWVRGPQNCSAPHGDFERFLAKLLHETRLNPACLSNMALIPHVWQTKFGFWDGFLEVTSKYKWHPWYTLFAYNKSEQLANKKPVILLTSKDHFIQTLCLCVVSARLLCVWGGGDGEVQIPHSPFIIDLFLSWKMNYCMFVCLQLYLCVC